MKDSVCASELAHGCGGCGVCRMGPRCASPGYQVTLACQGRDTRCAGATVQACADATARAHWMAPMAGVAQMAGRTASPEGAQRDDRMEAGAHLRDDAMEDGALHSRPGAGGGAAWRSGPWAGQGAAHEAWQSCKAVCRLIVLNRARRALQGETADDPTMLQRPVDGRQVLEGRRRSQHCAAQQLALKCSGLPDLPVPFSPVHSARCNSAGVRKGCN